MKFITLKNGTFVHIVASEFHNQAYCQVWADIGDIVHDSPPHSKLCMDCKNNYLRDHTIEELFMEMI